MAGKSINILIFFAQSVLFAQVKLDRSKWMNASSSSTSFSLRTQASLAARIESAFELTTSTHEKLGKMLT